jgi:NAD(P)-dependent dehydrogenase (short-subunit alcohol dehydrogenase family)
MSGLDGRRCLVTGAASGLGRAIAAAYAAAGAQVVAVDRDTHGLVGLPAAMVVEDLAQPGGPARALAAAESMIGPIELLVNAAGISRIIPAANYDPATVGSILAVNLQAPMALCAGVLPGMRAAGGGVIINIVSELALVAQPGYTAYCASKGGLLAYTRALALECAAQGIRINAICPGPIDTPMLQGEFAVADDPAAERQAAIATMPIGRLGRANEIAELAVFLANAPALVQGAVLLADGGKTLQ